MGLPVQFVDLLLVFCLNDAALELEGRRDFAAGYGKLVGNNQDFLDGLKMRQLLVQVFHDAAVEFAHLGSGDKFFIGMEDNAVGASPVLQQREVRRQYHRGILATVAKHRRLSDQDVGFESVFNRLRRNELPPGGLDQVFLAVGDTEEAFTVEAPN